MNLGTHILILLNMAPFQNWSWNPVRYLEEIRYITRSKVLELQKYPQYNKQGQYLDPTVNLLILTVKCISREHKKVLKTLGY